MWSRIDAYLFKASDRKFRKMQEEDFEAYSENIDSAKNHICKITVINKRDNSEIVIENITNKIINYIDGKIHFYYNNTILYTHPIEEFINLNPNERFVLYNGRITRQKARKYWSNFKVEIFKLITTHENLSNIELYSNITHRTYRTLLNNYYLPVIDELFHYESTEAINILKRHYYKVRYLLEHITIKGLFILLLYLLIIICIILCSLIGMYNFLYIPIKLLKMLF